MRFAGECLQDGITPVFLGIRWVGARRQRTYFVTQASRRPFTAPLRAHPVYEEFGFAFPGWFPYNAKETEGKALVVVPGFRANLEASGKNTRLAYVSGWAALDNARNRSGAEELIPYSDHADFDELLTLVEQ